jgi:hypothetical protein
MNRKLVSLFAVAAIFSATGPALAGSMVTGLNDSLSAHPMRYIGRCPGVITFVGTVDVIGHFQPGSTVEIGYQFSRSDGATGQNQFFSVAHAGPHQISETWTLGGPQVPQYTGWEKFKAWVTDSGQHPPGLGDTFSNEAHFTLTCR